LQERLLFVKSAPGISCQEVSRREAGALEISCRSLAGLLEISWKTPGIVLQESCRSPAAVLQELLQETCRRKIISMMMIPFGRVRTRRKG
jgi:hypothetical protein